MQRESGVMGEMEEGKTDIIRVYWSECLEILERSSQLYRQTGLPKPECKAIVHEASQLGRDSEFRTAYYLSLPSLLLVVLIPFYRVRRT